MLSARLTDGADKRKSKKADCYDANDTVNKFSFTFTFNAHENTLH